MYALCCGLDNGFLHKKNGRVIKSETLVIVLIDNLNNMKKIIIINKLIKRLKKNLSISRLSNNSMMKSKTVKKKKPEKALLT
jgi:hypothetical protein